jgi:hypothetical protein
MSGSGAQPTDLEVARRLIPPEGNNWGEIAHSKRAESEFVRRIDPYVAEEFTTVWRNTATDSESHVGLDEILTALRRVGESFETVVATPETFIEVEGGVLVLLRRRGRTVTGLDFDEAGAALYRIEDGRLREMVLYSNQALALTDAGLSAEEAEARGIPDAELPMSRKGDD